MPATGQRGAHQQLLAEVRAVQLAWRAASKVPVCGLLNNRQQLGRRKRCCVLWQQRLLAHDGCQQRHGQRCQV